ncbi:S-layer homology domain-containing protein [Paenibacillus oryzisoli]|uniref:SLH domain-containing protein n=1 Tax=Paenibacillus oryzisoli TaxID=1850517 RepID=A0A198AKW7_9BACL|nr:S-layer homology domain-containing protein [Paenibacillus oryzisoli]OAS21877.1 hypothetical protein A8708_07020 [Paenibacillus oryzisoli]
MTMKKKLTVTTLAASIMFASIAGLPLSEKGLANKLGITAGVASAATVQDQLNALRTELARDTQGIADVKATRDNIAAHTFTDVEMKAILGPVWTKVAAKVNAKHLTVNVSSVFALFNSLDLFYDGSGAAIEDLINNEDVRTAINTLFAAVDLPIIGQVGGLSKQSIVEFQDKVIEALKNESNQTTLKLGVLDAFATESLDPIVVAMNTVVRNDVLTKDLPLSNFLSLYDIDLEDLNEIQENVSNYFELNNPAQGAQAKLASKAVISAGLRNVLADKIIYTPGASTSISVAPGSLSVLGVPTSSFIEWSLHSGTGVKYEGGKLVLDGGNYGTGIIQARDSKFGLLLYISPTLTLSKTDDTAIGGGGGSVNTPDLEAAKELNALKGQLEGASEEKKQEIFRKAQEAVANAIRELATFDLNKSIKVEGDTAKPTLNATELAGKMKDIAGKAKVLNDQLKQLNPNATAEKIQLTLDFGSISAKTTEIPLGKALLDAAIANGVGTVAIAMNGLSLGVNPNEFGADTSLKVTSQDSKVATSATQLPVAAGVYEFEFTSGGKNISNFNTPVEVTIPVPNGSKYDTELLSLAKIVDGKLEFYGGSYENGVLNALRTGFSTYTVVENKVEFGDTASVKAWAGRQIQVAASKGILEGRADQSFVPNGQVTRAEFAKMIVKTFSLESATATENFTDVNDSDWFKVYVASAVKNGIVNGKEEGKFDPNGNITRAEMAVMSARALALKGISLSPAKVDEALKGFTDVNAINTSLKAGVALAANEGIVIGEEGNVFNPNANSTRAEAAVVIYRLLNK